MNTSIANALNEDLRLQDLYSYNILDTAPEKDFDDLLELATSFTGCTMAAVSFVDKDRQWFKANIGLPVNGTARSISLCSHAILQAEVMVVEDINTDVRFKGGEIATAYPGLCFYAGAPIISTAGFALGTVCLFDKQPRSLPNEQRKVLQVISAQIGRLLELRLKNKVLRSRATELLQTEKALLQKTLQQQDEERMGISTELHENIAQTLAATKIYLDMAEGDETQRRSLITKSKGCIGQLIEQVRSLSRSLAPSTLSEYDLRDMLLGLRSRFCRQTGITVHFMYEGENNLPVNVSLALYRVVEAQLENVRCHARASEVWINMNAFQRVSLHHCLSP